MTSQVGCVGTDRVNQHRLVSGCSLIIALILVNGLFGCESGRFDVVQYRGATIKLSKAYSDFDQYKNDPDNIDPSETSRVQTLVTSARIEHSYANLEDLFKATGGIRFPGYGSGVIPGQRTDGPKLFAVLIEIPRADRDRILIVRENNGRYELMDDSVEGPDLPSSIHEEKGSFVFLDRQGRELFRRPTSDGR